jgi:DNA-binding NarL/FixJ family response regulator
MTKTNLDFTADEAKALPVHQGNVMLLLLTGHTYEQIAIDLGIATGTVKSRINRAWIAIRRDREERARAAGNASHPQAQADALPSSESSLPASGK